MRGPHHESHNKGSLLLQPYMQQNTTMMRGLHHCCRDAGSSLRYCLDSGVFIAIFMMNGHDFNDDCLSSLLHNRDAGSSSLYSTALMQVCSPNCRDVLYSNNNLWSGCRVVIVNGMMPCIKIHPWRRNLPVCVVSAVLVVC